MVFALADGAFVFLAFIVALIAAITFAYYSKTGSEITQRPFRDRGDSDLSVFSDRSQDVRDWSRGTGGSHRRNMPPPRTPEELEAELDPETRSNLEIWRERLAEGLPPGLVAEPDPERDHSRGPDDAPVTIVAYSDFQCPSCQEADWEIRALQKEHPEELRYVFRHFPLADAHAGALDAAQACEYAAAHGRFWEMHDAIYRSSRPPSPESLRAHATQLGLDPAELDRVLSERPYAKHVAEDFESGARSGVNGTPTLFVNGTRHDDASDRDTLRTAVGAAADLAARRG